MLDPHERKKNYQVSVTALRQMLQFSQGQLMADFLEVSKPTYLAIKIIYIKGKQLGTKSVFFSPRSHAENTVLLLTSSLTLLKNAEHLRSHLRYHKAPLSGL